MAWGRGCTHASSGMRALHSVKSQDPLALWAGRDHPSFVSPLTMSPWRQPCLRAGSSLGRDYMKQRAPTMACHTRPKKSRESNLTDIPPVHLWGPRRREWDSEKLVRVMVVDVQCRSGVLDECHIAGVARAPATSRPPAGEFGRVGKALQLGHVRPRQASPPNVGSSRTSLSLIPGGCVVMVCFGLSFLSKATHKLEHHTLVKYIFQPVL